VTLVARAKSVRFHNPPETSQRTLLDALRSPMSGLGPGWRSRFSTDLPLVFHALPERLRVEIVRRHLGPAPGWWTRGKVEGRIPMLLGRRLVEAIPDGERVTLAVENELGKPEVLAADHIIAATGYLPDIAKLPFLGAEIRSRIATVSRAPALTTRFESSLPGLFFVGVAAANSFGPMMRFAFGAGYTARRLSRHLARSSLSAPERVTAFLAPSELDT
jgi:hypothetical protein